MDPCARALPEAEYEPPPQWPEPDASPIDRTYMLIHNVCVLLVPPQMGGWITMVVQVDHVPICKEVCRRACSMAHSSKVLPSTNAKFQRKSSEKNYNTRVVILRFRSRKHIRVIFYDTRNR